MADQNGGNNSRESVAQPHFVAGSIIIFEPSLRAQVPVQGILFLTFVACSLRIFLALIKIKKYRAKRLAKGRPPILDEKEYYNVAADGPIDEEWKEKLQIKGPQK
ncbi:unnamed protein product [Bursaphelenchus xylophilus]|uniref:(pine wood nematode) hypothetical protein n=1 Tax=Bursaphelenchus xylophilus TaxID=6326 RepID=A0A1I7SH23_BURXY|nr:unnamed protein product [Bursaphelenchus xylophilus]CAG9094311.1 unnamed protein product [Bursaphelenchus xylophilus]